MSGSLFSRKRRGELLHEDAAFFAPQNPYWIAQDHAEEHFCVTCGKRIPAAGLCELCQVIFKLGMAYVAEQVGSMTLEGEDQDAPVPDVAAGKPSS